MKQFLLKLMSLLLLLTTAAYAQDRTITGTVTSAEDNQPMPSVTVLIKGTSTATQTDIDGKYSIKAGVGSTLVFSFVGYTTREVKLGSSATINISLVTDSKQLGEVVVAALGIKREKKALGYSVSEVKGEELSRVKDPNVVNSLSGKVAGVNISQTASGAAGSSKVVIRGSNSLSGNNQVLYVVDGMPIDNSSVGQAGRWGGLDMGSGISDINPDDVAEVSVLKGPNAAALYGSRGANGVILITTKKGSTRKGLGVNYSLDATMENPMVLPETQHVYGQGVGGAKDLTVANSYGAKLGATDYADQGNRFKDFYQTGTTLTNSIDIDGGNEKTQFRLGFSNLNNKGIVENNTLKRNTFTLRGTSNVTDNFKIDGKVTYTNNKVANRPSMSDDATNTAYSLSVMPANISLNSVKNPYKNELTGVAANYGNSYVITPYYSVYENLNSDTRNRFISFVSAEYQFTKSFSAMLRAGLDYGNTAFQTNAQIGHYQYKSGRIAENSTDVRENNNDFLLKWTPQLQGDFSVSVSAGGNNRNYTSKNFNSTGLGLVAQDQYTANSGTTKITSTTLNKKEVNSLYAFGQFGYKNGLFLDLTARNDWSSTLPSANRSYFYPSASLSAVFTDLFQMNSSTLSFLKGRASYAIVGNDTDPYRLLQTYKIYNMNGITYAAFGTDNVPYGEQGGAEKALSSLKPEETKALEFGVDARLFQNRLGIDVTYYNTKTTNQILAIPITAVTGFQTKLVNAGEVQNKGIEVALTASPIKNNNFKWDVQLNFARNINKVNELVDGIDAVQLGDDRGIKVNAVVGQAYGALYGFKYKRDPQNRIVVDADGIPLASDKLELLGNYNPDFTSGLRNSFSYRNFSLSALIDAKVGGEIYSIRDQAMNTAGTSVASLEGREGGFVVPNSAKEDGSANTTKVSPSLYWSRIGYDNRAIAEAYIMSATNVRLRELSFGYNIPKKWLGNAFIKSASLTYVGRNLFFLYKETKNFDPESNYNNGNAQGIESASLPSTTSHGLKLSVSF